MFISKITLEGQTFGSRIEITVAMPNKGGLSKGEALRIVEDIADQIAKQENWICRWESFKASEATAAEVTDVS